MYELGKEWCLQIYTTNFMLHNHIVSIVYENQRTFCIDSIAIHKCILWNMFLGFWENDWNFDKSWYVFCIWSTKYEIVQF